MPPPGTKLLNFTSAGISSFSVRLALWIDASVDLNNALSLPFLAVL